jgi:gliding motility-associated-like protein
VLISAPNGFCPDSSRVNVYVHKISTINQLDTTICQGESVTFKPRVDGNYSLYPSFNVADNGENDFVITPYSTTGYLLANDLGCVGNDSLFIRVIDCSYFIPNVVTPDGDGKNDQFFIQSDIILSAVGKIYNRWGNLMYENDLQKNPWDCTKGNSTVSDGTYFYSIDVITKDGESFKLRGEFTLFSE